MSSAGRRSVHKHQNPFLLVPLAAFALAGGDSGGTGRIAWAGGGEERLRDQDSAMRRYQARYLGAW